MKWLNSEPIRLIANNRKYVAKVVVVCAVLSVAFEGLFGPWEDSSERRIMSGMVATFVFSILFSILFSNLYFRTVKIENKSKLNVRSISLFVFFIIISGFLLQFFMFFINTLNFVAALYWLISSFVILFIAICCIVFLVTLMVNENDRQIAAFDKMAHIAIQDQNKLREASTSLPSSEQRSLRHSIINQFAWSIMQIFAMPFVLLIRYQNLVLGKIVGTAIVCVFIEVYFFLPAISDRSYIPIGGVTFITFYFILSIFLPVVFLKEKANFKDRSIIKYPLISGIIFIIYSLSLLQFAAKFVESFNAWSAFLWITSDFMILIYSLFILNFTLIYGLFRLRIFNIDKIKF